jgi:hypothetical protein
VKANLYIEDCLLELRRWHCHWKFYFEQLLEERKESKQNNHEILLESDNTNVKGICQFIMNFEDGYV